MSLSPDQVAEYRRTGLYIARQVLKDADLQPVIDELSAFIDQRARQLKAEGKIEDLHEDAPFETRYGLIFGQSREINQGMDIMQLRGKAMFDFLCNKNMLDLVESLVGPEITCNPIQHVRAKPPSAFEEGGSGFHNVPWHQDAGVMMPEAEGSDVITFWLPLGEAQEENGCMHVIPDVVNTGYLKHQPDGGTSIRPELMPDTKPVVAACSKGDVVILSRFTPHHSKPNLSNICRWSLDLRYQPTGHHTGRTAHPDFVARSRSNPNSELRDHAQWDHLWVDALENSRGVSMHRHDK
jgi:phytanoyl-CoA hydroxylase